MKQKLKISEKLERFRKLEEEIKAHDLAYHTYDDPKISDFEYDIVKRITYFKLNIENKNGHFILLVHQKNRSYNCIKIITNTRTKN